MPREELLQRLSRHQADPGLTKELRRLSPDSTDDLA